MKNKQKLLLNMQIGFVHIFLILGLVFIVGAGLSIIFLQNFAKRQLINSSSTKVANSAATSSMTSNEIKYKTYTSLSGSGLTFDYPDTWWFEPPTKLSISRGDSREVAFILSSQKPTVVNGKMLSRNNMCITFNEMAGPWPYRYQAPANAETIAEIKVGQSKVSLVLDKDHTSYAAMQLLTQDSASPHGGAYIQLKNGYYLLATAQKNCFIYSHADEGALTNEIEQTKSILKSVRIAN